VLQYLFHSWLAREADFLGFIEMADLLAGLLQNNSMLGIFEPVFLEAVVLKREYEVKDLCYMGQQIPWFQIYESILILFLPGIEHEQQSILANEHAL
jgi:hypothetical protein